MIISWTGGNKDVIVDDSSYRLRKIMGKNNVTLNFSLDEYIEFPLGCTIGFQNEQYTLNTPQTITEVNSTNFKYKLVFGSSQEKLANFKVKDVEGGLKFPFTAKPIEHIQLLVNVLNVNDSGWSVGVCLDNNEKLISYNHTNCSEGLQMIADEFKTEWEIKGKTINLRKVSYNESTPLALSYGKGNGFVSGVGRKNDTQQSGFNILYVQGGERNIDLSQYGSKELLLPISKTYTHLDKTYISDAKGLNIQRSGVVIENVKEESLDASHIYPHRVGTITEVVVVDAEKNFYDFKDASIPDNLNFSEMRMEGEKITIAFQSGKLSGREFDILQSDTAITGYVHAERKFVLVPKEEDGFIMPNDVFIPQIGDEYAVFGMMLPNAYISDDVTKTGASWEMFKEAAQHFYENEESKFTFKGKLDGIWAKSDWINIGGKIIAGGYVLFSDLKFETSGIKIRIVSVKDFINNPHSPTIELANSIQGGSSIASDLDQIKQNEVVTESLHRKALDFTRRYFRDGKETLKLLQAAQLNFDSSINPINVETMALMVGEESLQFRFVDTGLNQVSLIFSYNQATKVFSAESGKLQHLTLGVDAITPSPVYRVWDIPLYVSAALAESEKSYYLYAKVSKTLTTGVFLLSETSISLEEVTGFYHLLTGILNTEFEEDRSFVKMFGFTEILPGQIKVDKLTSGNGLQTIELLEDQIKINAKVTFSGDSPALGQVATQQDTKIATAQTLAEAYADAKDVLQKVVVEAYADGVVTAEESARIAEVSQAVATAQASLDALVIGGRNMISGSEYLNSSLWTQLPTVSVEGDIRYVRYSYAWNFYQPINPLMLSGGYYTISGLFRCSVGGGSARISGFGTNRYIDNLSTSWEYRTYIVNWGTPASSGDIIRFLASSSSYTVDFAQIKIEKGTKATAWTPAPEDVNASISTAQANAISSAKSYSDAEDLLKETTTKAYADGIVTDEETRAIADATARRDEAKAYAEAQDNLLQTTVNAYADGVATTSELAAIATAQASLDALVIGGRNMISGSEYLNSSLWTQLPTVSVEGDIRYVRYSYAWNFYQPINPLMLSGGYYTISGLFRCSVGGGSARIAGFGTNRYISNLSTSWEYRAYIVNWSSPASSGDIIRFLATSSSYTVDFAQIKIEKGTKATTWSPAPEDTTAEIVSAKDVLALKLGYVDFADMSAKALLGETIISGGSINTVLIDAVAVIAKFMSTELLLANSVISDNNQNKVNINATAGTPFEVFNSGGTKQLELVEINGSVQFIYRNKNGDIIWYMGESGMEYAQFTAEAWVTDELKSVGPAPYTLADFGISMTVVWEQGEAVQVVTKSTSGVNYHEFVSATNAGTIVDPTPHGKTFTTQNKNGTLIPNGFYFDSSNSGVWPAMINPDGNLELQPGDVQYSSNSQYINWYGIPVKEYSGGKIISTFTFYF